MKKICMWIGVVLPFLFLFLIMFSCSSDSLDLRSLREGSYYLAQDDGRDVVLFVEKVTKKSFKGRWYVENGALAEPHPFRARSSRAHRMELRSDALVAHANALRDGGILVLDLLMDGDWHTLSFAPWQQPSAVVNDRGYPYHDNLFRVAVDSDVVYARAKGYWTSYPEPEDMNNYLSIVMAKMNADDLSQEDLDLTMDVYRPITRDETPRPLLLLIHGGAFFNGDKRSEAFVKWGRYFASRGYVVASINYRIGFLPLGPDHIDRAGYRAVQDAYAAVSYLLSHPERYPIDPEHLFVGGCSAGGITALNLAFMRDWNRPECTKEGFLHLLSHEFNAVAERIPLLNRRERNDIGTDDLGNINALVIDSNDITFSIDAVVNMWGALHDVEMLGNDTTTAILSFHGDADSVVAYGYDYPFTVVKRPAVEFLANIKDALDWSESSISDWVGNAYNLVETSTIPLNQLLCNKMYGSRCIHDKAIELNMRSELHTKLGGGHSLHVNEDGSLSDYYTVITDTITRFLYLRMFPRPNLSENGIGRQQWYHLDHAGEVQTFRWEAEGGLVLEAEPDRARVLFFSDVEEHRLRIVGQQKNGLDFDEMYEIE